MPATNTAHRVSTNTAALQRMHQSGQQGYRYGDKDPIITLVLNSIDEKGLTFNQVSTQTGVTMNTLRNWDTGTTKRPQHATVSIIMDRIGLQARWLAFQEYEERCRRAMVVLRTATANGVETIAVTDELRTAIDDVTALLGRIYQDVPAKLPGNVVRMRKAS